MTGRITVAGGFYREICMFPPSDEYRGSGGRAAIAIAENEISTNFVTAGDSKGQAMLASIAQVYGFTFSAEKIPTTLTFQYQHGLSTPVILPPLNSITPIKLQVSDECVLQFGMLDADIEVDASTAIYDPQNPIAPSHVKKVRKSSRLAYVLNSAEVRKLGANEDVEVAANLVAQVSGADVVIVKRGALGALVVENGKTNNVPAFETSSVWPIGSGDVFAAMFALQWGAQNLPALISANNASRATAEYVESRSTPLLRDILQSAPSRRELRVNRKKLSHAEYDVYLAGPFFNMPQLWLVNEARTALRDLGLKVFSPYHDIGIGRGEDVAPKDIEALENSRVVFALLDGVDTGTIFESGYARAHKKPVIVFAQSTSDEALKMVSGTGCQVVDDFVSAIYHTAWAAWR